MIIPKGSATLFREVHPQLSSTLDIFEYCYFSRPDSVIDGISVYESRQKMGSKLAQTIRRTLGQEVVDETDIGTYPLSRIFQKTMVKLNALHSHTHPRLRHRPALSVAEALGKPYRHAFSRNQYIFRTFIMPTQAKRQKGVKSKLCPVKSEFRGKNVLLIDDTYISLSFLNPKLGYELIVFYVVGL